MEQPIETEPVCRSLKDLFFYKLDRNLAILGIVSLGVASLAIGNKEGVALSVGALATYIGNRAGK